VRDVKIEKIDENKLKVVLSFKDILELNLDITEISPESEICEKIFNDMLTLASQEYGFTVENSKLMIEAMPSYKEGFVMFVSKVEKVEEKVEVCKNEINEVVLMEIYKFGTLDTLKYAFNIVNDSNVLKSKVFTLDGLFYLLFYRRYYSKIDIAMTLISDFGLKINTPQVFEGVLNEYGKEISIKETNLKN
jgi:negative regulator of genetic competence, sporulation and motility